MKSSKPVILCILDGFGISTNIEYNAIKQAEMYFYNSLLDKYPNNIIYTSGEDVGLPKGQMGNSEVGHLTIGAGRLILQDLPRINKLFSDNKVQDNKILVSLIDNLKKNNSSCHLMGLISDGGVHSHIDHIIQIAEILAKEGIKIYIHAFTDGRDTAPDSALKYIKQIENLCKKYSNIRIASVCGRYYAMDRDKRWDRTKKAYEAIVNGNASIIKDIKEFIDSNYKNNVFDEFFEPVITESYELINDNDAIIMSNFRADRVRQLLSALISKEFKDFDRRQIEFSNKVGFTKYADYLDLEILFPSVDIEYSLGEVISKYGYKQLRIAETEKYAHVTFFLNGGKEEKFENEDRILINSPKVATYDLKPEMSAFELTDILIQQINKRKYDFIVVNYANPDMVGHTGNMKATIKALKTIDKCLEKLVNSIIDNDYQMIITADHGNAESMFDKQNSKVNTAHTTNPVPFILANGEKNIKLQQGKLADIAPTILTLLKIPKPCIMSGKDLIIK